jgi:hypothetical protein
MPSRRAAPAAPIAPIPSTGDHSPLTADVQLLALRAAWTQADAGTRRTFVMESVISPLFPERGVHKTAAGRWTDLEAPGSSLVRSFLETCTRHVPGARVQSSELYKVFACWAKSVGLPTLTRTALGRALRSVGVQRQHSNVNYWRELTLSKSEDDFTRPRRPHSTSIRRNGRI